MGFRRGVAMSIRLPAGVPPAVPVNFAPQQTQVLPDPSAIAQQKETYAKSLNQQLENGKDQILQENQQKKKALNDMAAHQKAMFALQVDQELKKQEATADHDMNKKIHDLNKAAHDQRMILEQQAANLVMEYNTKKAQEQFDQQQAVIAKSHDEAQSKLHAELSKLQPPVAAAIAPQQGMPATFAMPTPMAVTPGAHMAPGGTYAMPAAVQPMR